MPAPMPQATPHPPQHLHDTACRALQLDTSPQPTKTAQDRSKNKCPAAQGNETQKNQQAAGKGSRMVEIKTPATGVDRQLCMADEKVTACNHRSSWGILFGWSEPQGVGKNITPKARCFCIWWKTGSKLCIFKPCTVTAHQSPCPKSTRTPAVLETWPGGQQAEGWGCVTDGHSVASSYIYPRVCLGKPAKANRCTCSQRGQQNTCLHHTFQACETLWPRGHSCIHAGISPSSPITSNPICSLIITNLLNQSAIKQPQLGSPSKRQNQGQAAFLRSKSPLSSFL